MVTLKVNFLLNVFFTRLSELIKKALKDREVPLREFNTTYKSRFMQKSYLNGTILMWWYFLLASLIKSVNSFFASLLSPFLLTCSQPRALTNTLIHSHKHSLAHKFTNSPCSKAHLFPPSPTHSPTHAFRSLLALFLTTLKSLFLMSFAF